MHEWDTIPFTSVAIVKAEDQCPILHPTLVITDTWPGLDIMCYCEPSADFDTVYRSFCEEERAASTKCKNRDAIPTMYLGVLQGQKVCGKHGGTSFKKAQRPVDQGNGYLLCPAGTVPCD